MGTDTIGSVVLTVCLLALILLLLKDMPPILPRDEEDRRS